MGTRIEKKNFGKTATVLYMAAVFLAFAFHLLRYLHNDSWNGIYAVYYPALIPVLIAFTLYFRWGTWSLAEELFLLYWCWSYISRLLNGDFFLTNDADFVLNLGLGYVFLQSCLALEGKQGKRLLDWVSLLAVAYFSMLSLLGMYAVIMHRWLYNPFTGDTLCGFEGFLNRLLFFGRNSTECSAWFLLGFFLSLFLFSREKSLLLRIILVPAAILNYLALTMTFTRSARVAFAFCLALILLLPVLKRVSLKKISAQVLVALVLVGIFTPSIYLSFNATASAVRCVSMMIVEQQQEMLQQGEQSTKADEAAEAAPAPEKTVNLKNSAENPAINSFIYKDVRGLNDSGRISIYKSIIPTMQQEPLRLLRGSLCKDVMRVANTVLPEAKPHFHNSFLQLFSLTGLPGLLLVLGFCLVLCTKILRIYFSGAPTEIKLLTLPLAGSLIYSLLETSLFVVADFRAFLFYIIAGAVLAYNE